MTLARILMVAAASQKARVGKATSTVRVSLASASTPPVDTGHTIHVRARVLDAAHVGVVRAQLFEGSTARSGVLETDRLTESFVTFNLPIAVADAATITSYSNLEIRLTGYAELRQPATFQISDAWLEVQSPAVGGGGGGVGGGVTEPTPTFNGRTFTVAGAVAPFTHRDASTTSGSYGYTNFPLTATALDHYAARVADPSGLTRDVLELVTLESKGNGASVRCNLYAQSKDTAGGWGGDGATYWLVNELYLPTSFPNIASNGWFSWGSIAPRGLTGSAPTTLGMAWRNNRNELTWIGQDIGAVYLWDGIPATRDVWHVVARRWKGSFSNAGYMEIWYGRRAAPSLGLEALPLTLQTLNVFGSASYINNNTRRVNFTTLGPSAISPYPSPSWTLANYHRDDMAGWTGQVHTFQVQKVWREALVPSVDEIDPYYTGAV